MRKKKEKYKEYGAVLIFRLLKNDKKSIKRVTKLTAKWSREYDREMRRILGGKH